MAIRAGAFSELVEENAADRTGIDASRQLLNKLRHVVAPGKWRVLIMDECHRLSSQAWDVWLKPLEDGIPNTVFVFCTTEYEKVPKTIRSRAVGKGYYFGPIGIDPIFRVLRYVADQEKIDAADGDIKQLIIETGGSVRDCLNALTSFYNLGGVDSDLIRRDYHGVTPKDLLTLFNYLHGGRFSEAYWIVSAWMKVGLSADAIYSIFIEHCANLLSTFSLKYRGWEQPEIKSMEKQRKLFGEDLLGEVIEVTLDFDRLMRGSVSLGYSVQMNLLIGRVYLRVRKFLQEQEGATSRRRRVSSVPSPTKSSRMNEVEEKPPAPASVPLGFLRESDLDLLAKLMEGRVAVYKPNEGRAVIFTHGLTVDVVRSSELTRGKKRYILSSDVSNLLKTGSWEAACASGLIKGIANES